MIERMYSAGVSGYVLKSAAKEEIIAAIRKVFSGGSYYSEEISTILLSDHSPTLSLAAKGLTRREKQVLTHIASGFSNAEIAEMLSLSIDTIKTHRKNLMRKLNIKNTAGLVKYVLKNSGRLVSGDASVPV